MAYVAMRDLVVIIELPKERGKIPKLKIVSRIVNATRLFVDEGVGKGPRDQFTGSVKSTSTQGRLKFGLKFVKFFV